MKNEVTWYACAVAFAVAAGCGGTPPDAATPKTSSSSSPAGVPVALAVEPERVLPNLRTGVVEPTLVSEAVEASVIGYAKGKTTEVLAVTLPFTDFAEMNGAWVWPGTGDSHTLACFVDSNISNDGAPGHRLWIRRRLGAPSADTLEVTVVSALYGDQPAIERRVRVSLGKLPKSDAKLEEGYLQALARYNSGTPFAALLARYAAPNEAPYYYADWSMMMRLATGYESVEAALYADAKLSTTVEPAKANVPIESLVAPALESHAWAKMIAALPATPSPVEALASFTPADFYFVRAKGFDELQRLLDESDTWITPLVRLARQGGQRLDLANRYRTQLGLSKSELVRLFGPTLIRDVALVGSDPFLRQGSDMSLIIRSTDQKALANTLASKLSMDFPSGVQRTTFEHRGVRIQQSSTSDGALRQFLAEVPGVGDSGPATVVSNSRGAMMRIIEVAQGAKPALSAELDFRYMLLRDREVPSDVLAYAGDGFVRRAVSPAQRVLDARRQLARAELSRLGYGALLFGWLEGREPKDAKELVSQPWFDKGALRHTTGEAISFTVGESPHSSYGTPGFLEPLIDLPVPAKVTPAERDAYAQFAQSYTGQWSENVDPIALRVQVTHEKGCVDCAGTPSAAAGKVILNGHIRILPALNRGEYGQLRRMTGDGQASRPPPLPGYHGTLAIGKDSELREELSGQSRSFLGKDFSVDWLGDWVGIGVADEPSLATAVQLAGRAPELSSGHSDEFEALQKAPLYVAIDLKKPGAAAVALTVLRRMAEESAPDVEWGVHEKHGGASIVRVHVEEISFYYALTKQRLFVSLDLAVLRALIDTDGKVASPSSRPADAAQVGIDIVPRSPSGLLRAIAWLIEDELRDSLRQDAKLAELVLRGAPGRTEEQQAAIASAYLGYAPVTADGRAFRLERFGVTDPVRGSFYRPVYGEVPASGSPLDRLLGMFGSVKIRLGFDKEPGAPEQFSLRSSWVVERKE